MRRSPTTVPAARPRLRRVFPPSHNDRSSKAQTHLRSVPRLRLRADSHGRRDQVMILVDRDRYAVQEHALDDRR